MREFCGAAAAVWGIRGRMRGFCGAGMGMVGVSGTGVPPGVRKAVEVSCVTVVSGRSEGAGKDGEDCEQG